MARKNSKTDEIVGNIDPKYLVQKSDPLVMMRSVPFSLGELKILDTYISRINAADNTRRTVIFTKEEYEQLMGITCANYRALEKATKGMLGKIVELQMPNKDYLQFVLFTKAYYHKDEFGKPVIELTCSEEARDLFFCIGKYHYFSYALENVIKLTRKASYLLYVYIRLNRYRGEWDVFLNELRDSVLDCKGQESYQEYKIFKNRVLDPAVKEVNEKTDCHFEYQAIKRGRKVAAIKFIYHPAKNQLEESAFPELSDGWDSDEQEDWEEIYGSEMMATLAQGCAYEFGKEEMEQIFLVLTRINIPEDPMTKDLTFGRMSYLQEKYAVLNTEAAKKARNGEKPIRNRFKYFLSMLEKDAFQPAAYK